MSSDSSVPPSSSATPPTATPTLAPGESSDSLATLLSHPWVKQWGPSILIAILAFLCLSPSLRGVYMWDDGPWLTDNLTVRAPDGLEKIWTDTSATPQYYPMVFTTFWLEYRLWKYGQTGPDGIQRGVGYHAVNLGLHIGSALIIYAILRRLKLPGGGLAAWLSAAIFAIHPVNVETVAWVAERKNTLAGVFFFASLYFGFRYYRIFDPRPEEETPGQKSFDYALALGMFILAMLSKTAVCVVPPILILMLWWKRGRVSMKEWGMSIPFWVVSVGLGVVTALNEHGDVGATGPEFRFSFMQRLAIAGSDLWFYIGKLLYPFPVVQVYPRWEIMAGEPIKWMGYYAAPFAFAAMVLALFLLRKWITRGPVVAMLLFAGSLFPVLGFINFYTMVFTFVADHYQYFSCIAIIVLGVETVFWVIRNLADKVPTDLPGPDEGALRFIRLTTGLVTVGILLSLATLTYGISGLYQDAVVLWTFATENSPKAYAAWNNLATAKLGEMRFDDRGNPIGTDKEGGIEALKHSIEANPNDWRAYHTYGMVALDEGDLVLAKQLLDKSEEVMPKVVREDRATYMRRKAGDSQVAGPRLEPASPDLAHGPDFIVGKQYLARGDNDRAIALLKKELERFPNDPATMDELAAAYLQKKDYVEAEKWCRGAIEKKPDDAMAWFNLAMALQPQHREKEGMDALMKAHAIDPSVVMHVPAALKETAEHLMNPGAAAGPATQR